jgi:hypothetical protein
LFHRVYASVPGADLEFEARKKKFCEENDKEERSKEGEAQEGGWDMEGFDMDDWIGLESKEWPSDLTDWPPIFDCFRDYAKFLRICSIFFQNCIGRSSLSFIHA